MDSSIENGMRAQFVLRTEALAAGARQIGWKSAFGSAAAMEKMRISTPLVGFMTDKRRLEAGAAIDVFSHCTTGRGVERWSRGSGVYEFCE